MPQKACRIHNFCYRTQWDGEEAKERKVALIPSYKDIKDVIAKSLTVEEQAKIIELMDMNYELREERIALKERIKELEEKLALKESLIYKEPAYWIKGSEGFDGPFCQICKDDRGKLVRLQTSLHKKECCACLVCHKSFYNIASPSR
jgi:hypothetical protein